VNTIITSGKIITAFMTFVGGFFMMLYCDSSFSVSEIIDEKFTQKSMKNPEFWEMPKVLEEKIVFRDFFGRIHRSQKY
jgi:hypothetical protein